MTWHAELRELSDNALLARLRLLPKDSPEREQHILNMRFYGNMTQAEIGQRLGISQMHVSRLLNRALAYLRHQLTSEPGTSTRAAHDLSPAVALEDSSSITGEDYSRAS